MIKKYSELKDLSGVYSVKVRNIRAGTRYLGKLEIEKNRETGKYQVKSFTWKNFTWGENAYATKPSGWKIMLEFISDTLRVSDQFEKHGASGLNGAYKTKTSDYVYTVSEE